MSSIRIRKHLDSETLHVPELREFIGQDVEIVVPADAPSALASTNSTPAQMSKEFFNPPGLDELARRQGHRGPLNFDEAYGTLADADWEGFDEFLEAARQPPSERKLDDEPRR